MEKKREDAALLCAVMASSHNLRGYLVPACDAVGVDCYERGGAADLARAALWDYQFTLGTEAEVWAEAEAKIRTGWRPR